MRKNNSSQRDELLEMIKTLQKEQQRMVFNLEEMRREQERLTDEIRFQNFVLTNIPFRGEILN